ncbi:MAG TPA: T9SS type A sorting domain-containing protein [Ignavibacteria bacterium]|jgi:hypothetical protein
MKIIRFLILALLVTSQGFILGQSSQKRVESNQTDDPVGLTGVPVVFDGAQNIQSEADDPKGLIDVPVVFSLFQNIPNPFNPATNIAFSLPKETSFSFKVFNIIGQEVYSINESKPAGNYNIVFDGSNLSSGIYFYSLQTKDYSKTRKMILLK